MMLRLNATLTALAIEGIAQLQDKGVEIRMIDWLHAKIYISEREAIVSSLNLLESSFNESREAGCKIPSSSSQFQEALSYVNLLERDSLPYCADVDIGVSEGSSVGGTSNGIGSRSSHSLSTYQGVEAGHLICQVCTQMNPSIGGNCIFCHNLLPPFSSPQPFATSVTPHNYSSSPAPSVSAAAGAGATGNTAFCIRCRGACPRLRDIRLFCSNCPQSPDNRGGHCHVCGNQAETKLAKPLCYDCWTVHKYEFNL